MSLGAAMGRRGSICIVNVLNRMGANLNKISHSSVRSSSTPKSNNPNTTPNPPAIKKNFLKSNILNLALTSAKLSGNSRRSSVYTLDKPTEALTSRLNKDKKNEDKSWQKAIPEK